MTIDKTITKAEMLDIIKLLSALESWSFSNNQRLPDHTLEQLNDSMQLLTEKVLAL